MGFKSVGSNVLISRNCVIRNPGSIVLGSNVRIDDFSILSAGASPFVIGNHVHISAGCYIYGASGFEMGSFANLSSSVKIFTLSDSYCGDYMIGPMSPLHMRKVSGVSMKLGKHSIIGTNATLLPGADLGEGVAVGANSLVTRPCPDWSIWAGTPARFLKMRNRGVLMLEKKLLS